jgi:hypothetical protein
MPVTDIHDDDVEKVLELASPSYFSRQPKWVPSSRGNESISSIDMRDLPVLQEDDDDAFDPTNAHSSDSRFPFPDQKSSTPQLSTEHSAQQSTEEIARSPSPDIKTILSVTPRPRLLSNHSHSRLRPRKASGVRKSPSDVLLSISQRTSAVSDTSSRLSRDVQVKQAHVINKGRRDDSFVADYEEPVRCDDGGTEYEDLDPEMEARLERQLEGGGSDSDSSIDLHTPLP